MNWSIFHISFIDIGVLLALVLWIVWIKIEKRLRLVEKKLKVKKYAKTKL
jgi:hypothetical protein